DGSIKTEQAHPDGTVRIHSRFANGSAQERITDRYARPFYVCDITRDGTWTVSELKYQDNLGRISPFLASKRVTNSDGSVKEEHYNDYGKGTNRREYQLKQTSYPVAPPCCAHVRIEWPVNTRQGTLRRIPPF